jgi:hypothetical protein
MSVVVTSAKDVMKHIERGYELWHVSNSMLPGHWELRRNRETKPVSWDAILRIRKHYLSWFEENTEKRQESRWNWSYVYRQRQLAAGAL